jgi:tripartite-type tricarboxylate transporter receptor subunit TctC
MKELGYPIEYQMLRGIFGPPQMPAEAVAFYQEVFRRVLDTPEMEDFIERGAYTKAYLTGRDFVRWLEQKDRLVLSLMEKAGWLAR